MYVCARNFPTIYHLFVKRLRWHKQQKRQTLFHPSNNIGKDYKYIFPSNCLARVWFGCFVLPGVENAWPYPNEFTHTRPFCLCRLRRLLVCLPGCLGCLATKDAQGYSEGSFQLVSCWRAVRKFLVFCLINHQITTIAHSLRFCEEKPKDKRKRTWRETMPFANLLRSKASVVLAIPPALYEFSMPPFCRPPLCPFIFSSCLTKNLFSILLNSRSPRRDRAKAAVASGLPDRRCAPLLPSSPWGRGLRPGRSGLGRHRTRRTAQLPPHGRPVNDWWVRLLWDSVTVV